MKRGRCGCRTIRDHMQLHDTDALRAVLFGGWTSEEIVKIGDRLDRFARREI